MNKIVREHYPAAKLPVDLRGGLPLDAVVRILIEPESDTPAIRSLKEIDLLRHAPFRSMDDIVEEVRALRDESL